MGLENQWVNYLNLQDVEHMNKKFFFNWFTRRS